MITRRLIPGCNFSPLAPRYATGSRIDGEIYQGEPQIFGRLVPRSDRAPQRSSAPKSPFGISRRILQRMHVLERTPLSRAPCVLVTSESGLRALALTLGPPPAQFR